jgi:HSP20 family protein
MVPYRRFLSKPASTLDSIFTDPFFRSFFNGMDNPLSSGFRVDIREKDDSFQIEAELPGLSEEQINLVVDEGMLTIKADYQSESNQEESGRIYSERRSGHVERSFNLDNIDTENIQANYKNGILYVALPKEKPEEKVLRKIPIQVEKKEESQS